MYPVSYCSWLEWKSNQGRKAIENFTSEEILGQFHFLGEGEVAGIGSSRSPFGIAWALMAKVNATTRRCFFARSIKLNLIFKSVFVLTSRIARSSARCWKFAQTGKGASLRHFLPVLDRLHVRKDFHPRPDPIQGGKLELFVQVFFLFFLYGSDNAKKSVGLVADPGSEIKPIIKKVDSPKSIEI